jgi:dTDP-4-dehydrorhamnose 3,5-epimerase
MEKPLKILSVERLAIPEVISVRFGLFSDERGYFTEPWRATDFDSVPGLEGVRFVQVNESFSKKGVVRGLHFQWDPPQGKLVRVLQGRMIDLAVDLRKTSPTLGKVLGRDMTPGEWIWIPPGFAHGFVSLEDTTIEYFCTASWNPGGEGGITPLTDGLDWSLCDSDVAGTARRVLSGNPILSEKDRRAPSLSSWLSDARSCIF